MIEDATILRLILSQAFSVYYLLILIPIKKPQRRNLMIIILAAFLLTLTNALIIIYIGLSFYVRFYFFTLLLPYIILFLYLSIYKGAKLIFALLTVQVVANVTIINGLLTSYIFFGENHPLIDTVARILTYMIFLPVVFKFIRPTYLKMVKMLDKGWWILNSALILSYALAYYILFVPDDIFKRPEYFIHGYIGIVLSLLIYAIIFFLFIEIQLKRSIEYDKELLTNQVTTLAEKSAKITTIAYNDSLTGVGNRYSLIKRMDSLIERKQSFLVLFIDLDNLKEINDTYDHSKGDLYLKQFALAVQNVIKDQGEVYRFAGDEFVCLIMNDKDEFDIHNFKEKIDKEIIVDVTFYGFSLGMAQYPNDATNSNDLINIADQVMYIEKRVRTNRR